MYVAQTTGYLKDTKKRAPHQVKTLHAHREILHGRKKEKLKTVYETVR